MKVAFLFLTVDDHRQGAVWEGFFRDAAEPAIYCHPKFPDRVTQRFLRVIPETVDARHADISLVHATLLLLKYALQDVENEFLVLLSDSCVPLYDYARTCEIICERNQSWISYGQDHREEHRDRYHWLTDKDSFSFENFQKQHQWMILRRDHAELLLQHDHTAAFERIYAPDEHYFATVLSKLGVLPVYNQMPTWVNWDDYETFTVNEFTKLRPKTYGSLSLQDVLAARVRGCLFLRKVSAECDCSALTSVASWGPELLAPAPASGWSVVKMSNQALRESRGEWIHVVYDDTEVDAAFYELMPGDADVVFCRFTTVNQDGVSYAPALIGDEPMELPDDWAEAFLPTNPLVLPAVAFRRRVFEKVGLFFVDLPSCADWEILVRAALGLRWRYVPQRLIVHHERGGEVPEAERRDMFERLAILWRRHLPQRPLPPELRGQSPVFIS
ncbi:MAG: beta-1,6-N-acetylglucosaminyltransferase [Candidatus Xenobia bacterium]